jgi:hypothetical protein
MQRAIALFAVFIAALGLMAAGGGATPAGAQSGARIHLIHGIPDTPVDVVAGGEVVISDFQFQDTQDLSALAGQTLTGLQVRLAGTDTVAIDAGDVALPASGNVSIIANLDAAGNPALNVFTNDTSAIAAGQGRLVVRHTAAAPAVDVRANGTVAFSNLTNPNEAQADLPAGTISADVVPAGATEPVVIGPADLPITEGATLIVYAVGSLDAGNLTTITETIQGSGSAPGAVDTGNSPVSDGGSTPLALWVVAGLAGVAATTAAGRRAVAAVGARH